MTGVTCTSRPVPGSSTSGGVNSTYEPTCTVVICTRNRPGWLNRSLAALQNVVYPHFDVLVVDNAPSDDTTREAAQKWGTRYLLSSVPGLSRARNHGARACNSEIIAYIDDDSLAEPGWLAALVQEFDDPQVMAACGDQLPVRVETETEQECFASEESRHARPHSVLDKNTAQWFIIANFGGTGDGGNMAFRRSAFDIWPGFDARLGRGAVINGGEEHHAFFQLIELGYRVAYSPDAIVRHRLPSTVEELQARRLRGLEASSAYMTLLLAEFPEYRSLVFKYLAGSLWGSPLPWRKRGVWYKQGVRKWRALLAVLSGPVLYWHSRHREEPCAARNQVQVASFKTTSVSALQGSAKSQQASPKESSAADEL